MSNWKWMLQKSICQKTFSLFKNEPAACHLPPATYSVRNLPCAIPNESGQIATAKDFRGHINRSFSPALSTSAYTEKDSFKSIEERILSWSDLILCHLLKRYNPFVILFVRLSYLLLSSVWTLSFHLKIVFRVLVKGACVFKDWCNLNMV